MPRIVKSAEARRREILDCAMTLFAEQGYDATSITEVTTRIGISKGAFYHHFAAKEDLLTALAEHLAAEAAEGIRRVMEDETLDPFCRLSRFLDSAHDRKADELPRIQRAFEPLFRPENLKLYHRTHLAMMNVIEPMLTALIREGIEDRSFDTPDPENAARIILQLSATTHREVARTLHAATPADRDEAIDELERKIAFIGIVIDRMLGLPDGSLDLGDVAYLREVDTPVATHPSSGERQVRTA